MIRTRKLSVILAVVMLLQLGLSGWSVPRTAEAAAAGPVAMSFYPADNFTNAPLGTNLRILFDENVKLGASSAAVTIYRSSDNYPVETITAGSGKAWISDQRELIIDPLLSGTSNKFEPGKEYYVLIDPGFILNVSNNAPYTGIQNATRWNFRTVSDEDVRKPDAISVRPTGTGVAITSQIQIRFDEDVYAAGGSITLSSTDDTRYIPVTSSRLTGSGSNTIIITPDGALLPNTTYTVTVSNENFQDAAGNTFNGTSWSFTTDNAPVNLASINPFSPADDTTLIPVDANLTIRFDQNVRANAGKQIEIRRVSDNVIVHTLNAYDTSSTPAVSVSGNMVTINPPSDLASNSSYYVLIEPGAFARATDSSQWFYGISAATIWNFTTGFRSDDAAPSLSSVSPLNGGSSNNTRTNLVLTFNEPVYPNIGNIEIRQSVGGTLFRSIPITSPRVKGGGTNQLVVDATSHVSASDPEKLFLNNTKYYVTIGNRVIRDGAGKYFAGISGTNGWEFTITSDGTRPQLISVDPASGASAVDVQGKFTATFDKPIAKGTDPSKKITFRPVSTGVTVEASFYVDPTNNRRIIMEPPSSPAQPLSDNTNYYITIDEGAITDLVGNAFIGIQNQYQWAFLTKGGDTTPPAVSKSEASGSTIRLIYNEPLNSSLKPSPASYYVTVAGAPRNVTDVKVEGNMVILTLASSITSNQKVELSYTKPFINGLVQDLSGNQAESLTKIVVSNGFSSTAPVISSASASGSTLVMNFSEALMSPSPYAYTQFSVFVGGTSYGVSSIWHSGSTVQLTLSGSIPSGQTVRVSYTPGSYPLTGSSGNAVQAFANYNVNLSGTVTGGSLAILSAVVKGSVLTLTYNVQLNPLYVPAAGNYVVRVQGTLRSVSQVQVTGSAVYLTLSTPVKMGETVEVTYLNGTNGLQSTDGQLASGFMNMSAINQTTILDGLSGDFESADGGVGLKTSAATTMSDISSTGVAANRYTIMSDKFLSAVTTARNAGLTSPRIVFKVPDSERAAIVAIPVIALDGAAKQGDVTFTVQHGDSTYELALKGLNYSELANALGGSAVSNHILITIDRGISSKTTPLTTALGSSNASLIVGPFNYEVMIVNGTNRQEIKNFSTYISRTINTASSIDSSQTAVVWIDPSTGTLSYVPTTFESVNGVTRATFKRKGNSAYALVKNTSSFTDMGSHWAKDTVQMMARKFIVEGRTTAKYEPDKPITRGEFATYIAKGLGLSGDRAAAAKFKDVNANTAMGAYIGAAAASGIVNGVDSSSFKPNSYITRQDMATMMMRAWLAADKTVTLPSSVDSYLSKYTDRGKIGSYAKTNMAQAIYLGIINGKTATTLSPTTNASRAEGAVMIMRLLEKAELLTQ